jgi:hypothetical protein
VRAGVPAVGLHELAVDEVAAADTDDVGGAVPDDQLAAALGRVCGPFEQLAAPAPRRPLVANHRLG